MKPDHARTPVGLRWIDDLVAHGRSSFTTEEARSAHGGSTKALEAVLRRLRTKQEIASPLRGFHLVLPPEYRRLGCLPPLWFVDDLARFLRQPYYVALLSASELHGAAHQRPQTFQVMLPRPHGPLRCGGVQVDFFMRANLDRVPIMLRNTPKGTVRVASPEATAFDLVGYAGRSGGLDNAATVLRELAEELDGERLAAVAALSPQPWSQRLGWLLDHVGAADKTGPLAEGIRVSRAPPCVLDVEAPGSEGPRDRRWSVVVNTDIEVDG